MSVKADFMSKVKFRVRIRVNFEVRAVYILGLDLWLGLGTSHF